MKTTRLLSSSSNQPSGNVEIERLITYSSFASEESTSSSRHTNASTQNAFSYSSTRMAHELLFSIFVFISGYYCSFYLRPLIGHTIRPIPYQKLTSGDIILDFQLNLPLTENVAFPGPLLIHSCFTIPLLFMIVVTQMSSRVKPSFIDTHSAACVIFVAIGLSEFITQACKIYVGRLRPNFYALCDFDVELLECKADDIRILEARSSFPSGHSSFSMCGMGVIVWFLLGRVGMGIHSASTFPFTGFNQKLCALLSCIPLFYSVLIGCSRLVDNWHHPSDVIGGFLIGMICPSISYHLWYVICITFLKSS